MSNEIRRKEKNLGQVVEKVSTIETNLVPVSRYKMIPVDQQTHVRLMALCGAYGFGQRGQGAMVRKLINSEFEKIPSTLPTSNL